MHIRHPQPRFPFPLPYGSLEALELLFSEAAIRGTYGGIGSSKDLAVGAAALEGVSMSLA